MNRITGVVAVACVTLSLLALGAGVFLLHQQNEELRRLIVQQSIDNVRNGALLESRLTGLEKSLGGVAAGLQSTVVETGTGTQRAVRSLSSRITNSFTAVQGSISDMGVHIVDALPAATQEAAAIGQGSEPTTATATAADAALQDAKSLYASSKFAEAAHVLASFADAKTAGAGVRLYYAASLFHARPDDTSSHARIEKDLRAVMLEDPQNFVALETLGSLAVERGDWAQGLGWLSGALEQQPRDVEVLQKAGACAFAVKDFSRAQELLDRAAALSPGDANLHYSAAQASVAAGDPSKALERLDTCLSLQPRHLGALLLAGSCLSDLGRHSEAAKRFSAYLSVRPDYVAAARLGDALYAQGQRDAAEAGWKHALGLSTGNAAEARRRSSELHGKLTRSAWERGDPAQCKAYASEGLRAGPSPLLSVYLGMSLRALGDEAQGTRLLKQVKESSSDTEAAALAATALGDTGQ